ncbi:MAG: cell division protein FtsL [Saccharospirillum sp.]|nr:cell division protein FtsL [Saccharospirillum sp.]
MIIGRQGWLALVLALMVLATAFGVVLMTYQTRVQFAQLEALRQQSQLLEERWGKLLLEESAFSSPSRVERIARDELNMDEPDEQQVFWLDLNRE